jgi:hypothetical protein
VQFERIASAWIGRQHDLKDARIRFGTAFYSNLYGHDRLLAAANAFDILPGRYWSKHENLTPEEEAAISASRQAFGKLTDGPVKTRALNSLDLLQQVSLATKIKRRAAIVSGVRPKFEDLDFVCQQAAACRNYYVHGGRNRGFDYQVEFESFRFLIDTLEFVFAASDLIECGWELNEFCNKGTSMSHAFGAYFVNYQHQLAVLKSTVQKFRKAGSVA